MEKQYRYYAILDANHRTLDDPLVVVREWDRSPGVTDEERFTIDLVWKRSDMLHKISSGRGANNEAVEVSEEKARWFESHQTERARLWKLEND